MDEVMQQELESVDLMIEAMEAIDSAMRALPDPDKMPFVMAVMDAMFFGHNIRLRTSNAVAKAAVAAVEHWDEPASENIGEDGPALWRFGDLLAESWREEDNEPGN